MIEARNVAINLGGRDILKGLDLDIPESKCSVILGRSGIGKSVFLKCVCGLLIPQAGTIRVDGQTVIGASRQELREIRSKIGLLFQEGALFDSMTVFENIAFPLSYKRKVPKKEIEARVIRYAELVEMRHALNLRPKELSGGMKRKVAIARAMILEPRYLFYDEPTTGLDPSSSAVVEIMIKRLQTERDITSVVVTHDIDLARFLADTVALLDEGVIASWLPRDQAFAPDSLISGRFLSAREKIRSEHGY